MREALRCVSFLQVWEGLGLRPLRLHSMVEMDSGRPVRR